MKILQLCNKSPFPAVDGGAIAMGSMTHSMVMNGYDVTVLSMISHKHYATENDWPDELRKKCNLHFASVDLRLKPHKAFLNLFTSHSYHAVRFYSEAVAQKLVSLLQSEKFDVIQLETVFPFIYHDIIRQHSAAKIILRLHNMEHEVWETTARAEKQPLKKWYLALLAQRLKQFELQAFAKADGILTISSADFAKIKALNLSAQVVNIPLGIDLMKYPVAEAQQATSGTLFHLGAMDWIPNRQGIGWFLETAWKTLRVRFPQLHFHIAGRKMPEYFFTLQDAQLHVEGAVNSSLQFMQGKHIMVVPLLSGSGIRVKIIEGMALGKAVVTTSIGASGIDCTDEENILIANTPAEFAGKISACISDATLAKRIGSNARKLIEEKYALEVTARQLDGFLSRLS